MLFLKESADIVNIIELLDIVLLSTEGLVNGILEDGIALYVKKEFMLSINHKTERPIHWIVRGASISHGSFPSNLLKNAHSYPEIENKTRKASKAENIIITGTFM